jgi:hypothetical protein
MKFPLALTLIGIALTVAAPACAADLARPQGPCDIYRAAGSPCVAAHSTTRALYASYNGPLYQVKRLSDGKTLDIGIVPPVALPHPDPGGYADAAEQDRFCANAICVINVIYDQSGKGNHLYQAPPGTFKGPARGGFDTQPIADMAPISIGGHKAYGVYIIPGMGFRNNNAGILAIGDEPEGIYSVVDGTHFDSGCCFDYGNASTNGRAVGPATMETTYFGTSTVWGSGGGPGPWIMADMESGLYSGHNMRQNIADPTIDSWRFVSAFVDGGGGDRWDLRGGNAQKDGLSTFYSGARPGSPESSNYFPMRKQGAILLGTGGDNGNGSSGTFYEGAMALGSPNENTTSAVQSNIVAAHYDVQRVSLSRVTTFTPNATHDVTLTFTNSSESPAAGAVLSMSTPKGWNVTVSGVGDRSVSFVDPIAPGASVNATFSITAPAAIGAGLLTGRADWTSRTAEGKQSETISARARNVPPVKINEVSFGSATNPTNQFIEIYNASSNAIDLSNWSLVYTPSEWSTVKLATIPAGVRLGGGAYYLLGLAGSGLATPANQGEKAINVSSTTGLSVGQRINIDGEIRTIVSLGEAAAPMTTLFVPVSTGPWLTIQAGATNLPVTSATGFVVGQRIGIDVGGSFELASVTSVGKAGTQTTLSATAAAGATNIKLAADANFTPGDTLTIGTGRRKELVTVASVGGTGADGMGVGLTAPLKLDHMQGVDVSDTGTGIGFKPAVRFPHISGEAVQALGSGIVLDRPLDHPHAYGAPVVIPQATTVGYQGSTVPNQWFGLALSTRAGSLALMDVGGSLIVDAIVYGSQQSNSSGNGTIASPEIATLLGDQSQGGCIVVAPGPQSGAARSVGRFPDGADTGSLCTDFLSQASTTLSAAAAAGVSNIKVAGVAGFTSGQTITIDAGANPESAVIASVGTAGATVIPVAGARGFSEGQTIVIGSGADAETAVVESIRPFGGAQITVNAPLAQAHAVGAQVSGTGITFTTQLTKAHAIGTTVADNLPTPGAPNQYHRK